ncbi:hypothetical protein BMJ32_23460 [Sinorhizobium medicae]|nr:hypothetical protein BMJ35_08510 [Sinorhizobium medicae]PLT98315.1 hypothetical protein BMJ32_23460 [Sinorhizobium medicae]PLU23158.1 hypothetical protein BMJ31_15510 [Sinorhizobium medicae]PLU26757.1 hypothetical protein BMJ28_31515 [Sinorhizobium medicae]PLU49175.1 hypothetical protein BMJ24_30790 [Sinorhizobium medicae]
MAFSSLVRVHTRAAHRYSQYQASDPAFFSTAHFLDQPVQDEKTCSQIKVLISHLYASGTPPNQIG